jgi:predicted nucleotidyltransferase
VEQTIEAIIPELLMKHPAVKSAALTGSRMRGEATEWSDWDFLVDVTDFEAVATDLPELTKKLEPISQLWDPLSRHFIYMLILRGPNKVDIIFDFPHQPEPPWMVNHDTINQINSHFWDWILWIASKEVRGMKDVTGKELEKMFRHLLEPLGCLKIPDSIEEAVRVYTAAINQSKNLSGAEINLALENEVIKGLALMGFQV